MPAPPFVSPGETPSPDAAIGHRSPGFLRRLGGALLQKLDRDLVRRADEGHIAVARRPVDGNAGLHELVAGRVNIVHGEGEMAEIAAAGIGLRIPIIRELEQRTLGFLGGFGIAGRGKIDQRKAALFVLDSVGFDKAELAAIELERLLEVRYANHCVEIFHAASSRVMYILQSACGRRRRTDKPRAWPGFNAYSF